MKIKDQLQSLKSADMYSLMLFALYKMFDVPEYSAISELAYTLDKDNLIKLLEVFGGLTIKIPTTQELQDVTYALLLYQYVNIDGEDYEESLQKIGHTSNELRRVKANYTKLCEVMDKYDFHPRN